MLFVHYTYKISSEISGICDVFKIHSSIFHLINIMIVTLFIIHCTM